MMKTPLSIHVLYHSAYKEGAQVYSMLYKTLCRDTASPFMDGLDIPVYFQTGDDNGLTSIAYAGSEKSLLLLLVDINMFCSSAWREYAQNLLKGNADDKLKIVGVKLDSHAFSFLEDLSKDQMVVLQTESVMDNLDEFKTRLFETIIRYLGGAKTEKVSIFISHSKRDKGNTGETMAKEVRQFLFSDTKLRSFFDVHDILDGYQFDQQIKDNIKESLLLVLFTDTYSSREWCRIEALTAKENKKPMVVVSQLNDGADRLFPYIGNVPSTVFHGDWRPVINLLLRTAIDYIYESQLLMSLCDEHSDYLPYPPEAHSLSVLKEDKEVVFYPEPPLGNEEIEVLKSITNQMKTVKRFKTPMEQQADEYKLNDAQIAISVSDSEDLPLLGIGREMMCDLTVELSRHILKAGGKMIYGGDLRKDGYTKLFRDLSDQYGKYEKEKQDVIYFTNYLSWPQYNNMSMVDKADYLGCRVQLVECKPSNAVPADIEKQFVPPVNNDLRYMWSTSLTAMRQQAETQAKARVLVGGKIKGFSGCMAGVIEEFITAKKANHPVYLIGGFGGAAKLLSEIIEKDAVKSEVLLNIACEDAKYRELYGYYDAQGQHIDYSILDTITLADLRNNGLTDDENLRLFHSVNIMEIVSLVLKGLSKTLNHA